MKKKVSDVTDRFMSQLRTIASRLHDLIPVEKCLFELAHLNKGIREMYNIVLHRLIAAFLRCGFL